MALGKAQVFGALALGLLLMAYSAEAFRLCTSRSKTFHGACKSHTLCETVCHHEHFTGGHCSHRKLLDDDGDELAVDGGDGDLGGDNDIAWWRKKKASKCICVMKCGSKKKKKPSPPPPGEGAPQPPPGDAPPAKKRKIIPPPSPRTA